MVNVVIDEIYCKGCHLCIHYCPKKVLDVSKKIGRRGYKTPYVLTPEKCSMCKMCELICPEFAVSVGEDDE